MEKKLPMPVSFLLGFIIGAYGFITAVLFCLELLEVGIWRRILFLVVGIILIGIVYNISHRLMVKLNRPVDSYARLSFLYIVTGIVTVLLTHVIVPVHLPFMLQIALGFSFISLMYTLGDYDLENTESFYFIIEKEDETKNTA